MTEYILPLVTFLLVLTPLYIPIGVSIVHAVRTWRPRLPARAEAAGQRRRRLQPPLEMS